MSKMQLREYLISINGDCNNEVASQLEILRQFVAREKSINMVLNMMRSRKANGLFIGFLWAPVELEMKIKSELSIYSTTEFKSWRASTDYDKPHDI
jgi:hypothetical protein